MMELGEPTPINEEDSILKEEEIFWNFDNNIEMVDPLKIEVKEDKMNVKIESNYMVTSTQHEGNDIVNSQDFVKEEAIIDDSKAIVTSSNQSISDVEHSPVLPTGLLLYRLFNQIIIDALLGTQVNCGKQDVPMRKPPPSFEPEIDVMTSTQNWVDRHEFTKGRRPSRKFLKKKGSTGGELTVQNINVDVVSNALNSTEKLILLSGNDSDVCEKQKCNLCDKSRVKDVHKNVSVGRNDGSSSNSICKICDVDRRSNALNSKKQLQYRNNNDYLSKENDNQGDSYGDSYKKNQSDKNLVSDVQNKIVRDTCRNVIKQCYVIIDKMNVSDCDKYYVCSNCDNIFNNVITYETHKLLLCSFKDAIVKPSNESINHLCNVCGESFPQKPILLFEKHLKFHVDEEELKFSCKFCDKSTSSRSEFKTHTKLHADKCNFACNKCDKMFNNSNLLKVHKKKFHKNSNTYKFSCDFCKLSFTKRINRTKHKCVKFGSDIVKGHICKICNDSFPSVVALNVHTKKEHVRAKLFSCRDCDKSFSRKSSLLSHSKFVHEGFYDKIFVKL